MTKKKKRKKLKKHELKKHIVANVDMKEKVEAFRLISIHPKSVNVVLTANVDVTLKKKLKKTFKAYLTFSLTLRLNKLQTTMNLPTTHVLLRFQPKF